MLTGVYKLLSAGNSILSCRRFKAIRPSQSLRRSRLAAERRNCSGFAQAVCLILVVAVAGCRSVSRPVSLERVVGADWPMWRCDAARSAASPEELPAKLYLQWVRKLAEPTPAWPPWQYKLQFDRSYEPVVMDKTIFVPSMVSDSVTAYDTDTGEEKWRFYSDGPVRFAPVAWRDRIYFVSDDGCLYCLDAENGALIWKFRGGPSDRRILGNDRLISSWPARGAPVLYDGKIYFAASIWPFMGIFIYALDAETGQVVWSSSGSGSVYIKQQHNSPAFGGVAPQGYLAATEDKLLIPSRTVPACYDRKTGELLYYRLSDNAYGKYVGGYDVAVWKQWFFNNGVLYRLCDGVGIARTPFPVLADDAAIGLRENGELMAYMPRPNKARAKGLWKMEVSPVLERIHIKAGSRVYGSSGGGVIVAIDIPDANGQGEVRWQGTVEGEVWNMLAADGKLFVVTVEGGIYCFGAEKIEPRIYELEDKPFTAGSAKRREGVGWISQETVSGAYRLLVDLVGGEPRASSDWRDKVDWILQKAGTKEGYCLLLGLGSGELLGELIHQSKLHIIVIEPDAKKVASLRRELDEAGLYGRRVAVLAGDITSLQLPAYMASLIVSEDLAVAGFDKGEIFAERVFYSLRPYGGLACFKTNRDEQLGFFRQVEDANPAGRRVEVSGEFIMLWRAGALPGSGDWVGQYGDIANSVCSKDKLVKAPLGLLWFGDRSGFGDVLPRHGHGPPEQVVGGRLFIEGVNCISARDVYTGRILWKRELDNLNTFGVYYDRSYRADYLDKSYNQVHIPGANVRGTNFIATAEKVYVIEGASCRVLDAATGRTVKVISLPGDEPGEWGYIGVYEDYLIAGSGFAEFSKLLETSGEKRNEGEDEQWLSFYDKLASRRLVVMDRHTGDVLWQMDARDGFIHNAIAVGAGKIFCLDKLPSYIEEQLSEQAIEAPEAYRLLALDVCTGKILWERNKDVFGAWLSYSERYDVLLQANRPSSDMLAEPGDRMITYRGENGTVLWDKSIEYRGPCMLRGGSIITQGKAFNLLTGEAEMRRHPLTGDLVRWRYDRNYGCGTAIGSEHLLTFRSAAAGYFDLAGDGGTGNIGGFKSGCTSNLVVANGVLNAPDYTQSCTCSYQNQTSLALVHMPEAEMWTFNAVEPGGAAVRRVGINFGAPGDRKADNGTLWLDYPSLGGKSPDIPVETVPENPRWFRRHSSFVDADELNWVAASGGRGISSITITLGNRQERRYTVRLHFIEPDEKSAGERVFDVALQEKTVLKNLDIVRETGSVNVGLVKEFSPVTAADTLKVTLTPAVSAPRSETIICGIEVIADGW